MFFRTRQEKFPREFRIYSYDWDHTKVLDLLNRQERKIEELESQLHNFTSYAQQLQDEVNELEDELKNSQYLDLDSMKDIILRRPSRLRGQRSPSPVRPKEPARSGKIHR